MKTINKLRTIIAIAAGASIPFAIGESTNQENEYKEQLTSNCDVFQNKVTTEFQSNPGEIISDLISKSSSQKVTEQDSKITFAFNIPAESIDVKVPAKGFFTRHEEENCQIAVTTSKMQFIN